MTVALGLWLRQYGRQLPWLLLVNISAILFIGVVLQLDAGEGQWQTFAHKQILNIAIGVVALLAAGLLPTRWWLRGAWGFYAIGVGLLILVELVGDFGGGAQSWLAVGGFRLQPTELMRVALIVLLAALFQTRGLREMNHGLMIVGLALLLGGPLLLVILQPDLGSAAMLGLTCLGVLFVAGLGKRWFIAGAIALALAAPVAWHQLHPYQQTRLTAFLNPLADPLGSGYHVLQSQIGIGSAGFWGKGFLGGTQAHLKFLPEKHTDFVFTLLVEDFGLFGGLLLLALYVSLFIQGVLIALRCRNHFMAVIALGAVWSLALYVIVNVGMVLGLLPVVGVPLPLVSYGGSAMLGFMLSLGLLVHAHVHRDEKLPGAPGLSQP